MAKKQDDPIRLDVTQPIWDRIFTIAPLVVVGTREEGGKFDMAPKHMATPLSWDNYFGFVCMPSHRTYQNARREREFTVSFPQPDQVVLASLAASPRCDDRTKPVLQELPTIAARSVDCCLLANSYLFLECRLERIVDGFGENSLIAGRIIEAHASATALRGNDRDDQQLLQDSPLLAFVSPAQYATVRQCNSFPFPTGMRKAPKR